VVAAALGCVVLSRVVAPAPLPPYRPTIGPRVERPRSDTPAPGGDRRLPYARGRGREGRCAATARAAPPPLARPSASRRRRYGWPRDVEPDDRRRTRSRR